MRTRCGTIPALYHDLVTQRTDWRRTARAGLLANELVFVRVPKGRRTPLWILLPKFKKPGTRFEVVVYSNQTASS